MNTPQHVVARQQWMLIAVLIVIILGGGAAGLLLIRPKAPPARPVMRFTTENSARLRGLLDAGQYNEVVAESDRLTVVLGKQATVLRYKALAQLLLDRYSEAIVSANDSLHAGAAGAEAGMVNAVRALSSLRDKTEMPATAKEAAQRAIVQAGRDSRAGLLANVAYAALLRGELDLGKSKSASSGQVAHIRHGLEPLYAIQAEQPKEPWLVKYWRLGLAMFGECGIFAGQAGDAFTEAQLFAILQRCCPADVWSNELKVPERAVRAARQAVGVATVDDHARAALVTAVAILYASAGDIEHADSVYGLAMRDWREVLTTTEHWDGADTQIANGEQVRIVGAEYFAYRHCLERIAVLRANQWSAWVASGRVTANEAMAACEHPLFRAVVRLRVDKQVDPGKILREAKVDPRYWPVVADVIEHFPAGASAEWAASRAREIRLAATEPVAVVEGQADRASASSQVVEAAGSQAVPYAGLKDVAMGVGGSRRLSGLGVSAEEKRVGRAAAEPLPQFSWESSAPASRPATEGPEIVDLPRNTGSAVGRQVSASQPAGAFDARARELSGEIESQIAAGDVNKALDAYFKLHDLAAGDSQTSDTTRQAMQMFEQLLGSVNELNDVMDEMSGKPKKPTPKAPVPQRGPVGPQAPGPK